MFDPAVPRRIAIAATGIAAVMCGWLVILHLRMILSPAPQEMREGAIIWITRLLLEGRNPYALSELPASTDAYGIVYHLVVLPFARLFGNGYTVHRAVSAAAIAGSCGLLYRLLRRSNTDPLLSGVGVMLFYASSLYFVAPLARPDGVGVFFSMASMSLLFTDDLADWTQPGYPRVRFGLGLLFAMLALLTKVYLAYPPFVMAVYVLLFVSVRRGLVYSALVIGVAAVLLWTTTLVYPAYINVSIVDNVKSSTYYDVDHLQQQTVDWLSYSLPLTLGLPLLALRALARGSLLRGLRTRPSPFAFASAANATAFFAAFGGHPGAHMTYLFHLVTPVLIVALLPQLEFQSWSRALVAVALPVAFAANAHYFPLTFRRFRDAEATFVQLSDRIRAHTNVLGSTEVAGPLALAGRPVVDSGHSQYFGNAMTDRRWPGVVAPDLLQARWNSFLRDIDTGISEQRFDLIIRSRRPGLIPADTVAAHYVRTETFDVDFVWGAQRWPVDLWVPRR